MSNEIIEICILGQTAKAAFPPYMRFQYRGTATCACAATSGGMAAACSMTLCERFAVLNRSIAMCAVLSTSFDEGGTRVQLGSSVDQTTHVSPLAPVLR